MKKLLIFGSLLLLALPVFADEIILRNISWTFEGKNDPFLQMTNEGDHSTDVIFRLVIEDSNYRYPKTMEIPSGENRFIRIREIVDTLAERYPELKEKASGVLQIEFEGVDRYLKTLVVNLNPRSGITSEKETERTSSPVIESIQPEDGSTGGGTVVTIYGNNFTDATQVRFGGIPALRNIQSPQILVAVAPAHKAGAVDIEVTTGKRKAKREKAFRYEAEGPTLTSIDPGSGPLRGGTRAKITGKNFAADTVVRWNGRPIQIKFVDPQNLSIVTPSSTRSGAISVEVVSSNGRTYLLEEAFIYKGGPDLRSVNPVSSPMSGGGTLTIFGSNFEQGASVLFGNRYGQTTFVNSNTLAAVIPPGDGGYVDITVSNPDGEVVTLQRAFLYNESPRILRVSVDPNPIVRLTQTTIKVEASDPEGSVLQYDYKITQGPSGGRITGQYDQATYFSPNTTGTAVIHITITDVNGGKTMGTVEVEVQ